MLLTKHLHSINSIRWTFGRFLAAGFIFAILLPRIALAGTDQDIRIAIEKPDVILADIPFSCILKVQHPDGSIDTTANMPVHIAGLSLESINPDTLCFHQGLCTISGATIHSSDREISIQAGTYQHTERWFVIPGILSILPPLLAIVLALLLRQVVVSLFAGIWLGAVFVFGFDVFGGFLRVLDHYIINALADPDHVSIIAFSMLFGGMVGIISKNGGTGGIARLFVSHAGTPKRAQFATWLLGVFIFFDDYANSLIVGNTMRPVTDSLKVSREKLAYIVDSTAAPVSSLVIISTWVGYEVGLIDSSLKAIGYHVQSAYLVFIQTIPYRFYPILALIFGFVVITTGKDLFTMFRAEKRARNEGKLYRDGASLATDLTETTTIAPDENIPLRWWNAAIPILVVTIAAIAGLYITGVNNIESAGGTDFTIGSIIGNADSYQALLWASLLSCVVAIFLSVSQRILSLTQALDAWFTGLKSMLLAMLILTLAWSIGQVTLDLHTADYIVSLLMGNLNPHFLPVLTFAVAAAVSFATGTSWGTMGIIMPLVIPLSAALSMETGLPASAMHTLMLGTISSVLAGAVFGDHCSPISDTTILSSMASACDHVDHVRTQLPYALLVGGIGIALGDIPTAFGMSPYISIALGAAAITGILLLFGKSPAIKTNR